MYDIHKGDLIRQVQWQAQQTENDRIDFTSRNFAENISHHMVCDQDRSTQWWSFRHGDKNIAYRVDRNGEEVTFSGTIDEKPIDRVEEVGNLPWCQFHGYSLPALLHDKDKIEFFSVRPDDGKIFKLVAEREAVESITVQGEICRAVRVDVHLTGLLASMGSVSYWFREADLVFVKYKGMSGFPGSAPIIYELVNFE